MSDYLISKAAVQKMLYDLRETLNERYISIGISMALQKLEGFTPMDAVEVVRCKDCKESDYYSADDPDGLYCGVWDTVVRCNGYCDHGAKMDAKDIDVHTKDGGEPDGNPH